MREYRVLAYEKQRKGESKGKRTCSCLALPWIPLEDETQHAPHG